MSEFEVVAEAPPGSSVERSALISRAMEEEIRKVPEVITLFTTIGVREQYRSNVTDISVYVGLQHLSQRRGPDRSDAGRAPAPGLPRPAGERAEHQPHQRRRLPADTVQPHPARPRARPASSAYAQQVIGVLKTKPASWTWTPRRPSASRRCRCGSTAKASTSACASTRWRPCGRWWGREGGLLPGAGRAVRHRLRLDEGYRKDASGCPPSWCQARAARSASSPTSPRSARA